MWNFIKNREKKKQCIHYTKEVYRGCELKSAKSS